MTVCAKGIRALPVLCSKARRCSDCADVATLVRGYLLAWPSQLNELFWRFIPRVPDGMQGSLLVFEGCKQVPASVMPELPVHAGGGAADESESEDIQSEAEDDELLTRVRVYAWFHASRRPVLRYDVIVTHKMSGQVMREDSGQGIDVMKTVATMRRCFDIRRCSHVPSNARLEVPSSLADWQAFFHLCLFGPQQRAMLQTTLR
jgi:hypothetical protein